MIWLQYTGINGINQDDYEMQLTLLGKMVQEATANLVAWDLWTAKNPENRVEVYFLWTTILSLEFNNLTITILELTIAIFELFGD